MKLIKKIFFTILVFILMSISIILSLGYVYYQKSINDIPLEDRVSKITSKPNFTPFDNLPKNYVNAVISVEDHRYFSHGPIDFIGLGRAIYTNLKYKEFREGGSTITQQVAKNIVFNQNKSIIRKIAEIFAAFDLEKNYSKEEIFALYVNSSYFGDGYYCIKDASNAYFNKEPHELDLNESSILAGVPNAPSVYAPTANFELCKKRQKHVLNKMLENHYITQKDIDNILNK